MSDSMRGGDATKLRKVDLYVTTEQLSEATTSRTKDSRGHVIHDKELTLFLLHHV